jgi:alpha-mannosidase
MPYNMYTKHTKRHLDAALKRLESYIYTPISELDAIAWITPEPVSFTERESGEQRKIAIGDSWGKLWDCAWFHFMGNVPAEVAGKQLVLLIDLSGEGCVVDERGIPVLGLTTQSSSYDFSLGSPGKRVVPFADCSSGDESVDLWIEAGNNDLFGKYQDNGTLKEAHIAIFDQGMFDLYHDFRILYDLMQQVPVERARHHQIMNALFSAMSQLKEGSPDEVVCAREVLAPELAKVGGTPSLKISAIGHAHMDLAWLWPIRETIRKGARTFATVLHNMEKYPDYVFGASQPQLYQWMKDHYPELYAKVKTKIAEGRWEVQGAMWVEPDTNVPSGESFVRQLIYGKQFFREEFGIEPRTLWLPDVFGYSGALPQILKQSGVDYFMTQKLSWNSVNVFPHHTFIWQGIDGSQVLAHMPPENTYNSAAEPHSLLDAERNYQDKAVSDECLVLYGIGDGGGGPGTSHLEALKRESNLDGLPPVTQEYSELFFDRIAKRADQYKTWEGELYLEHHQGTFTTQARSKWFNRKLEITLREFELWVSLTDTDYSKDELDAIWKEMLLYQFHDILPGSSITRVYDESLERYEKLLSQVEKLVIKADEALATGVDSSHYEKPVIITNSLGWTRQEWVKTGDTWLKADVPSMGYTTVDLENIQPIPTVSAAVDKLENDALTVRFDDTGAIFSVFDKENEREVLDAPGNVLAVYTDNGDAWDIETNYRERVPPRFNLVKSEAVVDGPKAIMSQWYRFGQSTLEQQIILTADSRRVDFVTEVDWNETHKMLRTSFPMTVHANAVTCDIQYGTLQRSTHQNTSWDMAQNEICAHKWIDLSQPDYGVALLNDCKYGYYVEGNLLDLNLLRSPTYPDPIADRARHQFTYALYPHAGNHISGGVIQAGYELNMPLRVIPVNQQSGTLPASQSFLELDVDSVIIETVKPAEDGKGIIVRMYETHGTNVKTILRSGTEVNNASRTNLMEEHISDILAESNFVNLVFEPFEIVTIRLV